MFRYAAEAAGRGLRAIIAGAGGAAHLPGMVATKTHAAGDRRSDRVEARSKDSTRCSRSRRCRPASRSRRWRSAARPTPRSSPRASSRSPMPALRAALGRAHGAHRRRGRSDDPVIRTIGILGGGQLGRMLTLEAKRMGYRVVTLEPFPEFADRPSRRRADRRGLRRPARDRRARRAQRRRHLRVREHPAGIGAGARGRPPDGRSQLARAAHHPGAHAREDVRERVRDPDRRFRAGARPPTNAARARSAHRLAGRPQDDDGRLRRQGPVGRARRRTTPRRRCAKRAAAR